MSAGFDKRLGEDGRTIRLCRRCGFALVFPDVESPYRKYYPELKFTFTKGEKNETNR